MHILQVKTDWPNLLNLQKIINYIGLIVHL